MHATDWHDGQVTSGESTGRHQARCSSHVDINQDRVAANIDRCLKVIPDNAMQFKAITAKLTVPLLLAALVQPASAVQIRKVVTDSGTVLRLRGDVTNGDYRRLKTVLQNDAVVGLEIRSGGGSLEAGVDIARIVRDRKLVVYASRECDSVCAFIFFAARKRFMGRGCKIGVHSVSNERGKEDADSARITIEMSRLLVGLGVPHSIIGKIVATPPARITFLNNRDLASLNVQRTNPFRNIYDAARLSRNQQANSVCNPGDDPEALPEHGSCTTMHARASEAK
jgi:hypothetical protein